MFCSSHQDSVDKLSPGSLQEIQLLQVNQPGVADYAGLEH